MSDVISKKISLLSLSREDRQGVFHFYKKMKSDWVSSGIFRQLESYPTIKPFLPHLFPRNPYVRHIKKSFLIYAAF